MVKILETERLRSRALALTDTSFVLELLNSPGWLQFIGDKNVRTEKQAESYLENGPFKSYRENNFGLLLVEKKDDRKPIGMCGLLKRETLEYPDLGFAFLPEFHGKGYAFEIATATMAHAKETLNISKISAITLADNNSSIRLLEKLGFSFESTARLANSDEELLLYCN